MQIDKLKEIIQAANPEIMELKFGCEIQYTVDDSDFYGKSTDSGKSEVVRIETGLLAALSPKGVVLYLHNGKTIHTDSAIKFKILGRPIRLSDVLLAIRNSTEAYGSYQDELIYARYDLKNDDLNLQSDETKQFLINLLCKQ